MYICRFVVSRSYALLYHCSRRRWLILLLSSKINQKNGMEVELVHATNSSGRSSSGSREKLIFHPFVYATRTHQHTVFFAIICVAAVSFARMFSAFRLFSTELNPVHTICIKCTTHKLIFSKFIKINKHTQTHRIKCAQIEGNNAAQQRQWQMRKKRREKKKWIQTNTQTVSDVVMLWWWWCVFLCHSCCCFAICCFSLRFALF